MFNLGKSEQTNYFCFYSQTTFSFYPVQLWLGGKEGLENFLGPMLRDPPYFSPTHAGGLNRVMLAKQPTSESESASRQVTFFTDLSKALLLNMSLR